MGGAAPPPKRPKADKEGQGAEGSSEAEGRLEGQRCQRDSANGANGSQKRFFGRFGSKRGSEVRFEPADLVDYYEVGE